MARKEKVTYNFHHSPHSRRGHIRETEHAIVIVELRTVVGLRLLCKNRLLHVTQRIAHRHLQGRSAPDFEVRLVAIPPPPSLLRDGQIGGELS